MSSLIEFLILVSAKIQNLAKSWRARIVRRREESKKRRAEEKRIQRLVREFENWLDVIEERAAHVGLKIPWSQKDRLYFCFKVGVDPYTVSLNSFYAAIVSERPIKDFFRPKKAEF